MSESKPKDSSPHPLFQPHNELHISKALVDGLKFSVSPTSGALGRLNLSSSYFKLLYNQNLAQELIGLHLKQTQPLGESAGLTMSFRLRIQSNLGMDFFFLPAQIKSTGGLCLWFLCWNSMGGVPSWCFMGLRPWLFSFLCAVSLFSTQNLPWSSRPSEQNPDTWGPYALASERLCGRIPLPVVLTKLFPMSCSICHFLCWLFFVEDDSSAPNILPHLSSTPLLLKVPQEALPASPSLR